MKERKEQLQEHFALNLNSWPQVGNMTVCNQSILETECYLVQKSVFNYETIPE